jgi:hypothetical protein
MHPHASKRARTHRQTYTVFAFLNQSFVLLIKNKKNQSFVWTVNISFPQNMKVDILKRTNKMKHALC